MSRKKHKEQHEEHISEAWLIPYADILTLLLALFIVLYASAQVDQKKFDRMAQALSVAFSGSPALMDSVKTSPQVADGTPNQPEINHNDPTLKDRGIMQETTQLMEAKKVLDKYIANNNLTGQLQTELTEEGLMIRIRDTALFSSGSAEMLPNSQRFAAEIAGMLQPLTQKVVVSGHTDNLPINTYDFPSNWDLSAKRAVNFMKSLLSQGNVQPERFSAIGYGQYRPIATNSTEEGRAKNRRVEILVVRNFKI